MDALSVQQESPVVNLVKQDFFDKVIRGVAKILYERVSNAVQNLSKDGLILVQVIYVGLLGD
jgi:hypothetical protein